MSTVTETATLDRTELERRRAELIALKQTLTEEELALSTLRHELRLFENAYNRTVGHRQEELDKLKSRILDFAAALDASTTRSNATDAAFGKTEESFSFEDPPEEMEDLALNLDENETFSPDESLKKLFRDAARKFHPDLTTDPEEREKRHDLMARLNEAYLEMDSDRIRELIDEGEQHFPDQEKSHSVRQQLSRILKQTGQVRHRLLQIKKNLENLQQCDMARLREFCKQGELEGRNVLQEMADEADEKLNSLRTRVTRLASDCTIL